MSIKYKVIPRKNLQDSGAPAKFYANAITSGEVNLKQLSRIASQASTVSEADAFGVIKALVAGIKDELSRGNIVRLDDLGSFRISISSEGKATEAEVTASAIKSAKIIYRPATEIKNTLLTLEYKKE